MSRHWVIATVGLVVAVFSTAPAHGGSYGTDTPCEATIKPPPPKCANFDCSDPMFTVFHPTRGSYVSGHCAEMPLPLAYYDGHLTVLLGSANLAALGTITAGSGYYPVATHDGQAIAGLFVGDFGDTGVGPYREVTIAFPVNERKATVSTQNPYAFLSETLNPKNKVWMHKLILNELMPIDWGREILGFDKNPVPQDIDVRTTADDTTFAAADPNGNPILSGHLSVDTDPKAQAQAVSQAVTAPHGGEWLQRFLTGGALAQVNFVNHDVLHRTGGLMQSHVLVRIKSRPALGLFGPDSALAVDPTSDFGAAVTRIDFRPVISARVPLRMHLDTGFAS
jgi:hypothetical protein